MTVDPAPTSTTSPEGPSPRFDGRSALVTGAGSGIGLLTSEMLLERGAAVLAADLEGAAGLEGLERRGARTIACDVTDQLQRQALLDVAGSFDFLVNSAGVIRLPPVRAATEDEWDLQLGVNAKAVFFFCQQAGARLRPGGAIVNISSVAARNAVNTETAIYAASKAAVLSITRSFAHAYAADGIRVNAIAPGIIDTPMQDRVIERIAVARRSDPEQIREQRTGAAPLGRIGTPEDCAEAILWLLSPASAYLTGQAIAVDGGMTML